MTIYTIYMIMMTTTMSSSTAVLLAIMEWVLFSITNINVLFFYS